VKPAANFLASYREPHTGLPQPSYDLWEERHGIMAFTVPTVYAGLKAAVRMGRAIGDPLVEKWEKAAEEIKAAFIKHFYSEQLGRFVRMVNVTPDGQVNQDPVIDASMFAIWYLGLLPADDERVVRTMQAVESRLWVKTAVGGVARYENDYYHQVSKDVQNVAGNPWIICTLWLAEWYIAKAKSLADLSRAKEIIDWTGGHVSTAKIFAEQIHPYSGAPLSVAPLTWSHATYVLAVTEYAAKYQELS
jgi:GH15 family glucan-1,4-alpha-glucosidase